MRIGGIAALASIIASPLGAQPAMDMSGADAHGASSRWSIAAHGVAYVQAIAESGSRGESQVGSINWGMLELAGAAAGGTLRARAMASAEPLTLPDQAYPELLQASYARRGDAITDRAHAEPVVMEAALQYDRAIAGGLGLSLYAAPVGEPALGPVAYQHRPSAANDPLAPLGHHAQDDAHASYGVATLGLFTKRVRIEGSAFNARRPDAPGRVFAYGGARLDSYAGRVTLNPWAAWSASASYGYLPPVSGPHSHEAQHRIGASLLFSRAPWDLAAIVGANDPVGGSHTLVTGLLEGNRTGTHGSVFGRVEYVERSDAELALVGSIGAVQRVGAVSAGYARPLRVIGGIGSAIGVLAGVDLIPAELAPFYGSRAPLTATAYLRLDRH